MNTTTSSVTQTIIRSLVIAIAGILVQHGYIDHSAVEYLSATVPIFLMSGWGIYNAVMAKHRETLAVKAGANAVALGTVSPSPMAIASLSHGDAQKLIATEKANS